MRNLAGSRRDDADVRADVLQALALDSSIPASVGARADDGLVTMTGIVAFHYLRPEAEFICANVPGVLDINDGVTLMSAPCSDHIEHEIIACASAKRLARRR